MTFARALSCRAIPVLALSLMFVVSCGGSVATSSTVGGAEGSPHYDGRGFVVHEWGTDTIVVGSDGTLQRGLHHEEEDLPAFVYDRVKAGVELSAYVKMETPVTYFYSDQPRTVSAKVGFPHGIFSQWYPEVSLFVPGIAPTGALAAAPQLPPAAADPFLDVRFPFQQSMCTSHYAGVVQDGDTFSAWMPPTGLLDWGPVDVLAQGTLVQPADAPIDQYTWSLARQVASNAVRNSRGQVEQFLFYRGLGDFALPVAVTATGGGAVTLHNALGQAIGPVFVLNVGTASAAFAFDSEGIAPGQTLGEKAPALDLAPSLDAFVQSLGATVTEALDRTGLYHDEAVAMVNTWQRQWFRTPGMRLLYLVPQAWTDASIPLTIDPAPDAITRVMMIRVEVLTPELEAADTAAAQQLGASQTAAQGAQYFTALG